MLFQPDEIEVRSDPFRMEQVGEAPEIQTAPVEPLELDEEKTAPDTIPAPSTHPDPQPEYAPAARRVQE